MNISIKDLKETVYEKPVLHQVQIGDLEVMYASQKPLKDQVAVIDKIIDACLEKEQFFNPFKMEIIATIFTIQAYTDIEIELEDFKDIYGIYDVLNYNGIIDAILPKIEDYNTIVNWSHKCCDSICRYANSFMGSLQLIQQEQTQNDLLKKLEDAVQAVKNDPEVQKVLPFINKKV